MLVLGRFVGEQIRIGDDIVLTVMEIDRGKVRLGIQAPREVAVWRSEIDPEKYRIFTSEIGNKGTDGAV